jgi:CHAT domain-containing protein/tetratricopeptide (TPR) repeat protein
MRTDESFTRPDVRAELEMLSGDNPFAPIFELVKSLLVAAGDDPERAWIEHKQKRAEHDQISERLTALTRETEAAVAARKLEKTVELVDAALGEAFAGGLALAIPRLESLRAQALILSSSPNRDAGIEESIFRLERTMVLASEPAQRHEVLMSLGLAWGERVLGDRAENLETSAAYLRDALAQLGDSAPPELFAITLTNLAWALLRGERGDRAKALTEAVALCRSALTFRSPERNLFDWAHSQINLGDALAQLSQLDLVDYTEAEAAYSAVIENQARLDEKWVLGAAHLSLGRLYSQAASRSPEQLVETHERTGAIDELNDQRLLEHAVEQLHEALSLTSVAQDGLRRGHILNELATVLGRLDRHDEAFVAAEEAFELLTITSDPIGCASVGGHLGSLLAFQDRWDEAADVYRQALAAAQFTFHARLETPSREQDTRRVGNLHRWAAFGLARAGALGEAALALENGRARELTRRLSLNLYDPATDTLPSEQSEKYKNALEQFSLTPIGGAGAIAARALQETISEVRQLSGFERFAMGATEQSLLDAVAPRWPLVYIDPAPFGTLLLFVTEDPGGELQLSSDFLEVTSTEIYLMLVAGVTDAEASLPDVPASYLLGIGAAGNADVRSGLDQILPWLGSVIAERMAACLERENVRGVTLIACGPLGLTPIHAARWTRGSQSMRLIDLFDVRYAPAAAFISVGSRRAEQRKSKDRRLVALGDPTQDLPASRPEVEEIAQLFDDATCALGQEATWSFLRANAPSADYLHLACHASGGLFDDSETLFALADQLVTIPQLSDVRFDARLVTVSACQSALSNIQRMPEELVSIGTAMFSMGAACVIASLWPVNDAATAMLMTELYRGIIQGGLRPPAALRRAQLWLQGLAHADVLEFLRNHPRLAGEFERRQESDAAVEAVRGSDASQRPFAHAYFWAGFIATGV